MERVRSADIASHVGHRVRVAGWLHAIRRLSQVQFVLVRDGWGLTQVVAEPGALAPLDGVPLESVIEIEGEVRAEPKAPGGVELHPTAIRTLSPAAADAPVLLSKRRIEAGLATLLGQAVIANRHPTRRAVFRLGAAALRGFRTALDARGFVEIASPKLVASATEGGANVFAVKYFDREAYLAQSPQLYKQIMVGVFERVFEVGPVFRAEPHDTARHLNQYTSLDVELGFIEDHFEVMRLLVEVLREMLGEIRSACGAELSLLEVELPELPTVVPDVHFSETPESAEPDLSPEGERLLGERAKKEHGSDFLFVTGYPLAKRPFYTHPDPARPEYSSSFDLLFRGAELVTGGQRLHRHADYLAALAARGMTGAGIEAYLDAFRYGMPPHGGFAIGLERFLMQLLGLSNVRLAALFPRDLSRLVP